MGNKNMNVQQGHWLLAKMGKKVLRPGGLELTTRLLHELEISGDDSVVEFAPGIGLTASMVLENHPRQYTGIELNEEAASLLRKKITGPHREIVVGNATGTSLPEENATKVFGEAMLTMQADHRKSDIIGEAHRILEPGGFYGIHELALVPDDMDAALIKKIQRDLAKVIHVNARPLTVKEWKKLLKKEGFRVRKVMPYPMRLLESSRVIKDEGFFNTIKIGINILKNSKARKQILAMRSVFREYQEQMTAVGIVAEKL